MFVSRVKSQALTVSIVLAAVIAFVFVVSGAAMAKIDWQTSAEKSGFVTTPNYDETLAYIERLAKRRLAKSISSVLARRPRAVR